MFFPFSPTETLYLSPAQAQGFQWARGGVAEGNCTPVSSPSSGVRVGGDRRALKGLLGFLALPWCPLGYYYNLWLKLASFFLFYTLCAPSRSGEDVFFRVLCPHCAEKGHLFLDLLEPFCLWNALPPLAESGRCLGGQTSPLHVTSAVWLECDPFPPARQGRAMHLCRTSWWRRDGSLLVPTLCLAVVSPILDSLGLSRFTESR